MIALEPISPGRHNGNFGRRKFGPGAKAWSASRQNHGALSEMSTHWTAPSSRILHSGTPDQVNSAVSRLTMCRYFCWQHVHRYFLKAVRDPGEAEELDQEFAIRFLRGDFRRSDPDQGSIPRLRETRARSEHDQRLCTVARNRVAREGHQWSSLRWRIPA